MLSRDYIGRLTEAMAQIIAALAGFKEKGKFKEAIEEILHSSKAVLKLDLTQYEPAPYPNLMTLLKEKQDLSNDQLATLAFYFSQLGNFKSCMGETLVAIENYKKALVIIRWLQKNDLKNYVLQRDEQVIELEENIRTLALKGP